MRSTALHAVLDMTAVNKLNDMRLTAMARAFSDQLSNSEYNGLSFEDRFGLIVAKEWSRRKSNQMGRLM